MLAPPQTPNFSRERRALYRSPEPSMLQPRKWQHPVRQSSKNGPCRSGRLKSLSSEPNCLAKWFIKPSLDHQGLDVRARNEGDLASVCTQCFQALSFCPPHGSSGRRSTSICETNVVGWPRACVELKMLLTRQLDYVNWWRVGRISSEANKVQHCSTIRVKM